MPVWQPALIVAFWIVWGWPLVFRAPHPQKRPSITAAMPTRIGLLLECAAIFVSFFVRTVSSGPVRIAASVVCGLVAALLSWPAVTHLGKQFRVQAGLYADHELVTTGPYAVVRHPIYASLLAVMLSNLLMWTSWPWIAVSLALFIAGTEIRVRTEDNLLAGRFGEKFRAYQRSVRAYIPFAR